MNISRIALIAAGTGLLAWIGKAVTIGTTGLDGSLAEVLFFIGLVAQITAVIALGLAISRGRHMAVRLVAAIAATVAVSVLTLLVNFVIGRVQPADPPWFWGEINLWVLAALVLGLALVVTRRSGRARLRAADRLRHVLLTPTARPIDWSGR